MDKRSITLLKILLLCSTPPKKIKNLLSILEFNSRDRFRELYLTPLQNWLMIGS